MLRSRRPRSTSMPVRGSGVPRKVTSARNEWPWISSPASPSVVPGSEWAASKRKDLVNSHMISKSSPLSDTERLVRLQAEPPLRMAQAVVDHACGIVGDLGPVHRLQREAREGEVREILRPRAGLRVDQFQLMPVPDHELGTGFRADADPVDASGHLDGAVGFDRDGKTARMQ